MTNNLDFYAGVIATLKFSTPIEGIAKVPGARMAPGTAADHWFDAMGRKRPSLGIPSGFRSVSLWYRKSGDSRAPGG
jgi:hypothetical protein